MKWGRGAMAVMAGWLDMIKQVNILKTMGASFLRITGGSHKYGKREK